MRAATNAILAVVATAASLAACQKGEAPADQNITVDNGIDPNAEIEAVPADEGGPIDDNEAVPSGTNESM
jgi:hypothetical protein